MSSRAKVDVGWVAGVRDMNQSNDREHHLLRRAFDESPVGMGLMSLEPTSAGALLAVNPALAAITGRAPDDLVGSDALELVLPESRAAARRRLEQLIAEEVRSLRLDDVLVRPDGVLAWVQLDASPVDPGPGAPRYAVINLQDVTERKRERERAEARLAVTRILGQSSTVDGALSALVPALATSLGFEIGSAWVLHQEGELLRSHVVWQSSSATAPAFCGLTREISLAPGSGLPGRVWEQEEPQFSDDLAGDSRCPRASAAAADGLHSAIAFPVRIGSELAGVIELVSTRCRPVEPELMQLVVDIGEEMADLLARKRAQEHVTRSSELLLVEDNSFIARLVGEMLAGSDIELELVHVERLSDACDRVVESRPACVLLDLTLPDADGLQSLLQIRRLAPEVPLVVLTGVEDEELAVRAVQEGAQDYLVKRHVDMNGLARAIRYAMERKGAEQELLEHRLRDRLTGLPNRVLFLDRLRVALGRHDRARVALLLVNLDRFRVINDSLGHESGDRVLLEVADRLVEVCGPGATVAGLGGDEFAVLLDPVEEHAAILVAESVGEALQAPIRLDGEEVQLTATVGIAINRGEAPAQQLMEEADTAMSRGKELGGARCEVFEEGVRLRLRERLRLENGLRSAIERGELRLFYQPIVDLETRAIVAFEALVRWQHPEQGLLLPGAFMPMAEESGLVVPMGEWVLDQACAQMAAWQVAFPAHPELRINVNLSARQLGDPCLVDHIVAATRRHELAPSRLCLEVTETALVEDLDATLPQLHALKAHGFGLALDDFGTGYSSLSYLQQFPVDVLKLDRSFVSALRERNEDAIVAAVANMANALGLPPLAEGIEHEQEIERLRALGYTQGQGFFFGRPQEPDKAIELLRSSPPRVAA